MNLTRSTLYILCTITLIVFPLVALLIGWIFNIPEIIPQVTQETQWLEQIVYGTFYGVVSAAIGLYLVQAEYFKFFKGMINGLFKDIQLRWVDVFYFSFCAGFGEEILFRAGIQPLIGIWPAAILFILVHGYIRFKNMPSTIYGIFLIVISAGFGYLMIYVGLWSAIIAHMLYDVFMLSHIKLRINYTRLS